MNDRNNAENAPQGKAPQASEAPGGPAAGLVAHRSAQAGSLLGTAATMGMHMVTCPLVGAAMGYGLDRLLGTKFLIFVMLVLGIIAGFRCVWQDAQKLQREEERGKGPAA